MPLDPVLKGFLDQLDAQPTPKMWEMEPPMAREAMAAMMQLAGPQNIPIGSVLNIAIPGPSHPIPARAYTPVEAASGTLPALAFFHGGGFVIGNLETHDGLCRMLANMSGCKIISVDYRLSPEHPFPAAVEDAFAATSWIANNASGLNIDAARLAVGGDSAGGNLAAVVTQMARDAGGPKLAFQMLLFPATDMGAVTASRRDFAEGYLLDMKTMQWFTNHYIRDSGDLKNPQASPLLADNFSNLPPAFVMVAEFDPLHDEGVAYAEKLRNANVPVLVEDYPGMVHDFIYLVAVLPQASGALGTAAKALKSALTAG